MIRIVVPLTPFVIVNPVSSNAFIDDLSEDLEDLYGCMNGTKSDTITNILGGSIKV